MEEKKRNPTKRTPFKSIYIFDKRHREKQIRIIEKMKELIKQHIGESVSMDTEILVMCDYCDYLIELLNKREVVR